MLTVHRAARDRPDPAGESTFGEPHDRTYGVMT